MQLSLPTNPESSSPLNISSKDKFILVLNLPPIIKEKFPKNENYIVDTLQISIFGTVVPSVSIPAIDARYGGQSIKYSSYSRPEYAPLNINFVVDNDYKNYFLLWTWLSILNEPESSLYNGTNVPAKSVETEYQTTFSVLALDEYNEKCLEFKFHNAFLTNLGAITYSYKDGTLLESAAEFQFSRMTLHKLKKSSFLNK
jgi:hypothetical protein